MSQTNKISNMGVLYVRIYNKKYKYQWKKTDFHTLTGRLKTLPYGWK